MSEEKSRWQKEYDALPGWAQKMVRAASDCIGYGNVNPPAHLVSGIASKSKKDVIAFRALFKNHEAEGAFFEGFCDLKELANALTAPWPPPTNLPLHEKMTTENIVEMITAGDKDCAFDQKCYFGHRVENHAVYCHNAAWPNSPHKCRRGELMADIYGGKPEDYRHEDYRHEDCPGFVSNPDTRR